jgi:hypothetical protein
MEDKRITDTLSFVQTSSFLWHILEMSCGNAVKN